MIEAADRAGLFIQGLIGVTPPRRLQIERKIFLIATEESGDRLGANLMKVLRQRLGDAVHFEGVGGRAMAREGLMSLFPIEELSIIGLAAVVKELPKILGLIKETASVVTEVSPDILVIIDSPDFTHRVARRVRAKDPAIPIVNYVSPTVWAWRPGRARAMRKYVDHVLALLPFEPEAYQRLRGPPCSYVGHPLTEQLSALRPNAQEAARRAGSRRYCWCCREAAAAKSAITWKCSARRWGGCSRKAWRSNWCCRPCRICRRRSSTR